MKSSATLTPAEVEALMERTVDPRDRAILRLTYDLMLERGQIAALNYPDHLGEDSVVGLRGKFSVVLPLPTKTKSAVGAWIDEHNRSGLDRWPGAFFYNRSRTQKGDGLTERSIARIVAAAGRRIGRNNLTSNALRQSAWEHLDPPTSVIPYKFRREWSRQTQFWVCRLGTGDLDWLIFADNAKTSDDKFAGLPRGDLATQWIEQFHIDLRRRRRFRRIAKTGGWLPYRDPRWVRWRLKGGRVFSEYLARYGDPIQSVTHLVDDLAAPESVRQRRMARHSHGLADLDPVPYTRRWGLRAARKTAAAEGFTFSSQDWRAVNAALDALWEEEERVGAWPLDDLMKPPSQRLGAPRTGGSQK
ncbi:MAG TPA: hypothetical protein VIM30_08950 [Candidatus Limnocylindrales bacterium]|jgi:hypothetical protein